jgi:ADP-heptose:LPS heptosyltransferase
VDGSECPSCSHLSKFSERILFIKLDALGDVLRSASLLPAIIERHNAPYVAWLTRTESTELVHMMKDVDEVIELSELGIARIMTGAWDYVYSLSNDWASASLASVAQSKNIPIGYYVDHGVVRPSNAAAMRWLEMAAFDRKKRENQETYQRRMLSIMGFDDFHVAPPALRLAPELKASAATRIASLFDGSARRRIAVNVGAGRRWPKKMLDAEQIHRYITLLRERIDADVLLVGGASEREKANSILERCNTDGRVKIALTESSVADFAAILNEMDLLLCGDTLAMHVAAAIGLPTIAVFGPTSPFEIADFDGLIKRVWTNQLDCLICYGDCAKKRNCMSLIDLHELIDLTEAHLAHPRKPPRAGCSSAKPSAACGR